MSVLNEATTARITAHLRHNPKGLMISDLSHEMRINRNIMAKYLEILQMTGQVEMVTRGNAKIYTLSKRAPLSALFESSSDCILLLDGEGKILWVNTPVLILSGKKTSEIEGRHVSEIDNPFFAHLPHGEAFEGCDTVAEISFEHEGEVKYYRVKTVPAVLADGSNGSILSCEDITHEVIFQQMVERSEARYRAIVEDQTEFIARHLPDGKITFVNGSFARFWGKKPEEMFGTSFYSLFPVSEAERLREPGESFDYDHPLATVECQVIQPESGVRRQQWTIRALFDQESRITEFQVVGKDITEQTEAVNRIDNYLKTMEFLSKTGKTFMDMDEEDDIYEYIVRQVYSLAPGFLVWVGILDHSDKMLCLKGVTGNPVALDTMHQLTGMNVRDMSFPIDKADTARLIQHRSLVRTPPLLRLLHMQVPEGICRQIEETAGGIDSYLMGLVSKGKILGDVGISIPAGSELPNRELIEAFIQQAAIAIEKRIAENSLKESERLYRSVLDNIQDVYYRSDSDGRLVMASPSWATVLGYASVDECLGKDIAETFHLEPARREEFLDILYRNGEVRDYELVLKRRDGTPLHVSVSSHVLREGSGTVVGIEGIFRDITKRHRAEEKNREHLAEMEFLSGKAREFLGLSSEAEMYDAIARGLSELVPDAAICVSSCDSSSPLFTIRHVEGIGARETFRQMTGSDIIGFSFTVNDPEAFALIKTPKLNKAYGDLYNALFGQVPSPLCKKLEEVLNLGDIHIRGLVSRELLMGCATILLRKGHRLPNPELIEAFIRQSSLVLAWKKADEEVRRSEARFRAIVEDQIEFFTRLQPDGTLTFVNAPLCRAAGAAPQDLLGRSFFSLIPADDRRMLKECLQSLSAENPKMSIRHRFVDRGGRTRWFEWTYRAFCNDQGHVAEFDGIGRDITDLHKAMTRISNHHTDIRFLAEQSNALAGLRSPEEIMAFTAKSLHSVLPDSLVAICSYSPSRRELSFPYMEGRPEDLRIVKHELGCDLSGKVYSFEAGKKLRALMASKKVVPVPGTMRFLLSQGIQDPVRQIVEPCNFGRSYVMGLPSSDGTIDIVLLQLKADMDLQKPEMIEALINQAGLALARVQQR